MIQILFTAPSGEKFCKQCRTTEEKNAYVEKLKTKGVEYSILGEPQEHIQYVPQEITQNAIKPSVYLHIVFGEYAKDVLPEDNKTYITRNGRRVVNAELPTDRQINYLRSKGIFWLKGLSRKQADRLCRIVYERDQKGYAAPWQLIQIQDNERVKKLSVANKYAFLGRLTKEHIRILLEA